jgi:hypothetical protein
VIGYPITYLNKYVEKMTGDDNNWMACRLPPLNLNRNLLPFRFWIISINWKRFDESIRSWMWFCNWKFGNYLATMLIVRRRSTMR